MPLELQTIMLQQQETILCDRTETWNRTRHDYGDKHPQVNGRENVDRPSISHGHQTLRNILNVW